MCRHSRGKALQPRPQDPRRDAGRPCTRRGRGTQLRRRVWCSRVSPSPSSTDPGRHTRAGRRLLRVATPDLACRSRARRLRDRTCAAGNGEWRPRLIFEVGKEARSEAHTSRTVCGRSSRAPSLAEGAAPENARRDPAPTASARSWRGVVPAARTPSQAIRTRPCTLTVGEWEVEPAASACSTR